MGIKPNLSNQDQDQTAVEHVTTVNTNTETSCNIATIMSRNICKILEKTLVAF